MLSRLIFSSIRNNGISTSINQNQNFWRLASTTTTTTPTTKTPTPIGMKTEIVPRVSIVPKRGPSAYNLFLQEKLKDNSNKSVGENMKLFGPQWKKLSENEKRRYELESERLQKEYEDAFVRMSSDEFRRVVMDEMKRLQRKRVTALRRQQIELKKEYEYPKADREYFPLQAMANDHANELSSTVGKGKVVTIRGKKLGELWRNLSDEEKRIYEKRGRDARSKYQKNIQTWETKMKKQGLVGVVDTIKMRPHKEINPVVKRIYRVVSTKKSKGKILASKVSAGKKTSKKAISAKRSKKVAQKREE